ncbi:MAG: ABC transporter substrate-binding protein [Christensenellales bacterium]|jgi:peptide/nickel transport system substrate-binding protein
MKKSLVALMLAFVMLASLAMPAFAEEAATSTPLVVAYSAFSEKFSPFYADTGYDRDVSDLTQISIMTTDRTGGIVYNAIEGETIPYNGVDYTYYGPANISATYDKDANITTYTATIRDDMLFSDGVPVTADDIIFTYYVYLDTAYVGSTSLSSYDIVGLNDYRTQTTSDVYAKYADLAAAIYAAGADHVWSDGDAWTSEMQDSYWATMEATWVSDVAAIVAYANNNYLAAYADQMLGMTAEEVAAEEGLGIAFGMVAWGFGSVEEGVLTATSGATFDLAAGVYPTIEDYYLETYLAYEGDPDAYWAVEAADDTDVHGVADEAFIAEFGPQDEGMVGGVASISGIRKLDDYTVEVKTNGYEAPAIYSILGINITPLHYYGDTDLYDYENGMYGFVRGDLSGVEAKTSQPMGAGPYKFVEYENRVVYFEANENYYKGAPKIQYVQFKETAAAEVVAALTTGTADLGELSGSRTRFEEIAGYNTDTNDISGAVITTSKVDNLGYGYIGLNSTTMNVAGVPDSEESKNLRRGFATVISVYRDVAIDSYYGEAASVINYPISNTSWAAPQPTDEGYQLAFSVDVDNNPIFTADMTQDDMYAAAVEAAIGFFQAAGYTFDEATGKFTAAPEGAKLSYECYVAGDGTGDHPSFGILTEASAALATIGIDFVINDLAPTATDIMWDALDAGTQEMWCAAWGSTIDPDMYQVYYSTNVPGQGGTDSNHYRITDADLDTYIMDARLSDDQSYRKAIYKQALDVIVDWAVEIPTYQRQNCIVFSTERVNLDTLTPDITTFWGWMNDIQLLEMN